MISGYVKKKIRYFVTHLLKLWLSAWLDLESKTRTLTYSLVHP